MSQAPVVDVSHIAPIAFLDVAYACDAAGVAGVLADSWTAATSHTQLARRFVCAPVEYVPGEFYRRELPLLTALIEELKPAPAIIVIDGYVWLGSADMPGMGAHLFRALGALIPVIGVAKSRYRDDSWSERVHRGGSRRPLYVTAAGTDGARAAELVRNMHGEHRIPTLLQQADQLSRSALQRPDVAA
jgi:deoxyribonuclease V